MCVCERERERECVREREREREISVLVCVCVCFQIPQDDLFSVPSQNSPEKIAHKNFHNQKKTLASQHAKFEEKNIFYNNGMGKLGPG